MTRIATYVFLFETCLSGEKEVLTFWTNKKNKYLCTRGIIWTDIDASKPAFLRKASLQL